MTTKNERREKNKWNLNVIPFVANFLYVFFPSFSCDDNNFIMNVPHSTLKANDINILWKISFHLAPQFHSQNEHKSKSSSNNNKNYKSIVVLISLLRADSNCELYFNFYEIINFPHIDDTRQVVESLYSIYSTIYYTIKYTNSIENENN